MDDYLKGFIDGYNKAKGTPVKEKLDGVEIAKLAYKDITELQEKNSRIRKNFGASCN